ncbi:MAG TPA: hypothetical protein VIK18_21485, partial [Pirellulales bacterium]
MATLVEHRAAVGSHPAWLPGDRLSLARTPDGEHLWAPAGLVNGDVPLEQLSDPAGQPLAFRLEPSAGRLLVPDLRKLAGDARAEVELE